MTELIADKFPGFKKIARLNRRVVVTEKIDGTNGLIHISADGLIQAGSRNRWITPSDDNHGFAKWVEAHKDELLQLGAGYHYGEWWGAGIQRRYGMTKKRFSLFNTNRWTDDTIRPACCGVVPVLFDGSLFDLDLNVILDDLRKNGSRVSPGFMQPEGVVMFHEQGGVMFKYTFDKNDESKGAA